MPCPGSNDTGQETGQQVQEETGLRYVTVKEGRQEGNRAKSHTHTHTHTHTPALWEAKVEGSLEARSLRPAWETARPHLYEKQTNKQKT